MTEPTLFRKFFCKDRLPDDGKDLKYIMTEMGFMFFHAKTETKEWRFTKSLDEDDDWEFPAYWLEPVPEPTEDEIKELAELEWRNIAGAPKELIFIDGFKKAIELLKGK